MFNVSALTVVFNDPAQRLDGFGAGFLRAVETLWLQCTLEGLGLLFVGFGFFVGCDAVTDGGAVAELEATRDDTCVWAVDRHPLLDYDTPGECLRLAGNTSSSSISLAETWQPNQVFDRQILIISS